MLKLPRLTLVIMMVMFLVAVFQGQIQAFSGSGTKADPYRIVTAQDLRDAGQNDYYSSKYMILMNHIDMSGEGTLTDPVLAYNNLGESIAFTGDFNGQGYCIFGLTIDSTKDNVGLFGTIGSGARVRNLALFNCTVKGNAKVGAICGENYGDIVKCFALCSVSGNDSVGGICGDNRGTISKCYAECAVTGNSSVGGLSGRIISGTIDTCYARSSVSCSAMGGGICGMNVYGMLSNSFATGEVSGFAVTGGLCGDLSYGEIRNCYSSGSVPGVDNSKGGFLGNLNAGTITGCFWNTQTSGRVKGIGFGSSTGLAGLDSDNMHTETPFINAGWDFVGETANGSQDIWYMGYDYPHLSFEIKYSGGIGAQDNPYIIAKASDLVELSSCPPDYDRYFIMTKDIDMATAGTFGQAVIAGSSDYNFNGKEFTGQFNGGNHTIRNLSIAGDYYCGLFGRIGATAVISNIKLADINLSGSWYAGGLCSYNNGGRISNCHVSGIINADNAYIGGLCGYSNGIISICSVTGTMTGAGYTGGLCGYNENGSIAGSYAAVNITACSDYSGGLCGVNLHGSISDCYATGNVVSDQYTVGGLCGENSGPISGCYATGDVWAYYTVGGLCGYNYDNVTNSYATGDVTAPDGSAGGLCGSFYEGNITNCYATGKITGSSNVGGMCGDIVYGQISSSFWDVNTSGVGVAGDNNFGAIGKTTTAMKGQALYIGSGWDFVGETGNGRQDIWLQKAGNYPQLAWQCKYSGGSGTASDPYKIATLADLVKLGETTQDYSKSFIVTADIDLAALGTATQAIIAGSTQPDFNGTVFTGCFDGNGHKISNLTITGNDYCGLFGKTGFGAEITDLILKNVSITADGKYTGGLCGDNSGGNINQCGVSGSVNGHFMVGGLCGGISENGKMTGCYAIGSANGSYHVGGLCGYLSNCTITNSYSQEQVGDGYDIGILCGSNKSGVIKGCYATGSSTGYAAVNGFCGDNNNGSITDSFWDVDTSGRGVAGDSNFGAIGKTTVQMQTLSTYTSIGWDFAADDGDAADWVFRAGNYPRLTWQLVPGDIAGNWGVETADFACLAQNWLAHGSVADINGSGTVDMADFAIIAQNWLLGL